MTRPTDPLTELGFELERFEWTADDRLELAGRWFGVRGRRFMRPVINLRAAGRRRRLIAVLDHKPWAADGEGAWTAAFAWRGEHDDVTAARLEVAPDVILDLPTPGAGAAGAVLHPRPKPARPKAPPPEAAPSSPEAAPSSPEPEPSPTAPAREAPRPAGDWPGPAKRAAPKPSPPAPVAQRRIEEERDRLAVSLADAEQRIAALVAHEERAVERANEVVRLEGELAQARERAAAADHELAALRERVAAAEQDLAAAHHELAALRERAAGAEQDLSAARERAAGAEHDLSAAREELAALRERAPSDAAEQDLAAAREELAALRERAAKDSRDLASARERVAALEARAGRAERELASRPAADRTQRLERERDAVQQRADRLERELTAVQAAPPPARAVPDHVLAARGIGSQRERGWAARAVGLVWIALLLIVLVAIVVLVF